MAYQFLAKTVKAAKLLPDHETVLAMPVFRSLNGTPSYFQFGGHLGPHIVMSYYNRFRRYYTERHELGHAFAYVWDRAAVVRNFERNQALNEYVADWIAFQMLTPKKRPGWLVRRLAIAYLSA